MKHKHAELMLQYAVDALETDKPWERWECTPMGSSYGYWDDVPQPMHHIPCMTLKHDYRRKADAPPVPWHFLDRYVHESAVNPQFNPQESVKPADLSQLDDHKSTDMSHKQHTPVDLSVLIDSGIDCTWIDVDGYAPLDESWSQADLSEAGVEPRMKYWFSNANDYWGGVGIDAAVTKLVDAGFDVDVNRQAYAFRIHGLRDGYCWPWEIKE